jgi:hypothetical protein
MVEQSLENHNAGETGRTQRAIARDEDALLVATRRGDSAAFEMLVRDSGVALGLANRLSRGLSSR